MKLLQYKSATQRKSIRIHKVGYLKITLIYIITFILSSQLSAQVKPTSGADRLKGLSHRQVLEKKSTVNGVKFRSIGPTVMSGRVTDIDANAEDPTEF
ncbi:MAG TPA: hypothetical protein VNA26_04910, partial [Chitinophagaceae bacterium]|nr:hypothetical protein [Chitinophagaceae bacterium]